MVQIFYFHILIIICLSLVSRMDACRGKEPMPRQETEKSFQPPEGIGANKIKKLD